MSDSNGKKLVSLPAVQFYLHKVKLSPDAQVLYDEVSNELTGIVKGIIKSGSSSIDVTHIRTSYLQGKSDGKAYERCVFSCMGASTSSTCL